MSEMQVIFHNDPNGNDFAVEHRQDVAPILEENKRLRTMEQKSDWGRAIAEIPNVILVKWMDEEHAKGNTTITLFGEEMDKLVQRKLKDPEWAYLRIDRPALQMGWHK